jgi:cold shock protein
MRGIIKWFNESKGYGFIKPAENGPDVFLHVSGCRDFTPKQGDQVEYEVVPGSKGPQAINVKQPGQPDRRLFVFNTRSTIKNYFRGRASDPEFVRADRERQPQNAYAGLYGDPDGHTRVDVNGFNGWMDEQRLREIVLSMPRAREIWFSIKRGEERLPGSTITTPIIDELSAADLVRELDNLRADQCPHCRTDMIKEQGVPFPNLYCPRCFEENARRYQ